MIPGKKTSELYVLLTTIAVWAAKSLGFNLSSDQVTTSAVEVAKHLHALQDQGFDHTGLVLAGLYLIARSALKWKEVEK